MGRMIGLEDLSIGKGTSGLDGDPDDYLSRAEYLFWSGVRWVVGLPPPKPIRSRSRGPRRRHADESRAFPDLVVETVKGKGEAAVEALAEFLVAAYMRTHGLNA
jgi:hypothetical protein